MISAECCSRFLSWITCSPMTFRPSDNGLNSSYKVDTLLCPVLIRSVRIQADVNNFVDSLTDWSVTSAQFGILRLESFPVMLTNRQDPFNILLQILRSIAILLCVRQHGQSTKIIKKPRKRNPSPSIGLWYHSLSFIKGSRCDFL